MKRLAALALIPLSLLPFAVIVPAIVRSHERYVRANEMGPLPAPAGVELDGRFSRTRAHPGRVPVLVWNELEPRSFARQLLLLRKLGYRSISAHDWGRFRAGERVKLPARPVLLTVDGGRLDAYRRADAVLKRLGMRATMFAVTGPTEDGDPDYLRWNELQRMRASGRWDVQPGAHRGRSTVAIAPDGRQAPFYAARRYTRSGGVESRAAWERRVAGDLFALRTRFEQHGIAPVAIAVPYGDTGARTTNDRALPRLLRGLLERQFGNWFAQAADADFTTPGDGRAERFALDRATRPDDLYRWLRRHAKN